MHKPRHTIRALSIALVGFNSVGNYFLSLGMREMGETISLSPMAYIRAMGNVWVLIGVVLLIGWLVAQLSLLSWADLTYVLPITATSYVITVILGAVLLNEHVTASRWAGVVMIFGGTAIVSRTRPRTGPGTREDE